LIKRFQLAVFCSLFYTTDTPANPLSVRDIFLSLCDYITYGIAWHRRKGQRREGHVTDVSERKKEGEEVSQLCAVFGVCLAFTAAMPHPQPQKSDPRTQFQSDL
jgi:hypothetical protein